jgi:hypothetical protein
LISELQEVRLLMGTVVVLIFIVGLTGWKYVFVA